MTTRFSRRGLLGRAIAFPLIATACFEVHKGRRTASAASPAAKDRDGKLKTSLNAYSFSKLLNENAKGRGPGISLLDVVAFCARQGFEGIDATGYFFPGYPAVPAGAYVDQLKRRATDLGLGISGTGVRNNFTTADRAVRAQSVEHIKQWVEVAARLGAPVLRVFADTQMRAQTWETISGGRKRSEVESWIADNLRECAEYAKKFSVIIGVQNHGDFLKTSADHLSLIKRVNSEWCGPIVDTGYYKSADPYQDMAAVAPYAVNWQIKESPIAAGSEVHTDLRKLLTIIRKAGYQGYLPIETLSARGRPYDPFEAVPKLLAELRQAIEATRSVDVESPGRKLPQSPDPAASRPTAADSAKTDSAKTDSAKTDSAKTGAADTSAEPASPASADAPATDLLARRRRPGRKPPNKNKRNPAVSP